jgi:inner membrane protein
MDPLTHYLSAKVTQHLFIKEPKNRYVSIFLLSAVFPDIDYVTRIFGMATYLKYHRGITHSFIGIAFLSAGLAYLFSLREKGSFKYLFSLAYLSMFIHIMLDWTNSYGTKLFLPFSDHRAALDAIFIIDIYILAVFTVAIIILAIKRKRRFTTSLIFSLVTLVYILTKITFNQMVISKNETVPVEGRKVSVAAFPGMFAVNKFKCVIDTEDRYYTFDYYLFDSSNPGSGMTKHMKMESDKYTDLASGTYLGGIFLDFARYPLFSVHEDGATTLVKIKDMRYQYSKEREGFTAKFWITDDMKVEKESFRF